MKTEEIIALQGINGIGSAAISKVISYLEHKNAESLLDVDISELLKHSDISRYRKKLEGVLTKDFVTEQIAVASHKLHLYKQNNIHVISITDSLYPASLKLISTPPELLFCKGNLKLLSQNKNVAVIGTRDNTCLGEAITRKTTHFIVSKGYNVVSGLALGIDAIAHDECLNCFGKAIAVLVDVDNVQPTKNKGLAERIITSGGLLISENAPGIPIVAPLFVKRDRIQAGLSLAVFPIETSVNGGTMHAVNVAKATGRLIYIPDPAHSGYEDKSIKQLSGIIALAQEPEVTPYTKKNYAFICDSLIRKEIELFSGTENQGSLF